jgi:hypothetical protein
MQGSLHSVFNVLVHLQRHPLECLKARVMRAAARNSTLQGPGG